MSMLYRWYYISKHGEEPPEESLLECVLLWALTFVAAFSIGFVVYVFMEFGNINERFVLLEDVVVDIVEGDYSR